MTKRLAPKWQPTWVITTGRWMQSSTHIAICTLWQGHQSVKHEGPSHIRPRDIGNGRGSRITYFLWLLISDTNGWERALVYKKIRGIKPWAITWEAILLIITPYPTCASWRVILSSNGPCFEHKRWAGACRQETKTRPVALLCPSLSCNRPELSDYSGCIRHKDGEQIEHRRELRTYVLGQLMPDPFYVGNISLAFEHSLGTNLENDTGRLHNETMKTLCTDRRGGRWGADEA